MAFSHNWSIGLRLAVVSSFALLTLLSVSRAAPTHYVSLAGTHTWPYDTWATAATNIQAAVTSAVNGDVVLVTNGTYASTQPVTNIVGIVTNLSMVNVTNGIIIRSVNGPSNTVVRRSTIGVTNYFRIFYLSHPNAVISGFTITCLRQL